MVIRNKKIAALCIVLLLYVTLIAALFYNKQRQETRSRATASTTLNFSPSSSPEAAINKDLDEQFSIDVTVSPGSNIVSFLLLDVEFDPEKVTPDDANPIEVNTQKFPEILEGPVVNPGSIKVKVAVGSDPTKAITEQTKVATLHFKATGETGSEPTEIRLTDQSVALSLNRDDRADENVLQSTGITYLTVGDTTPPQSPTPFSCAPAPADIVLVIDESGSMSEEIGDARNAAKKFVDIIAENNQNRIGAVSYETQATHLAQLTDNYASVKTAIDKLRADGGTCTQCGIDFAGQQFKQSGRQPVSKAVVLLTDGRAMNVNGDRVTAEEAEAAAIEAVKRIKEEYNPIIFTIGLGSNVNAEFLQEIANMTGGKYYFPPSASNLDAIYQEIAKNIGKGSVSGTVFNDANNNGVFDQEETPIPNWTLELRDAQNKVTLATTKSKSNGSFILENLCNGVTYIFRAAPKSGWSQTMPKNPNYYTITIGAITAHNDKHFGFKAVPTATPSPTPKVTRFSITVFLHGIGAAGDNLNPDDSLSNKDPLHWEKPTKLYFFNGAGVAVETLEGSVQYDEGKGSFTGVFESPSLTSGNYIIKVGTQQYLQKRLSNFYAIKQGESNTLPVAILVAGDTNTDNRLNIIDYNVIRDCYSDTQPARNCNAERKLASDINDDGNVNQKDYNLFLRELSVQNGD
jgi:hypothetical protein